MKVTIKLADWLRIAAGQSTIINGAYDDMNEMYQFLHKKRLQQHAA